MESGNCKDELVIKLVGRLSLEFTELNQLKLRDLIEETMYKYDVTSLETALITTDIDEKLQMYLAVKKLDGLSIKTLKNYNYNLVIFGSYLRKPLSTVNTTDIRMFLAQRCQNMKSTSMNGQITILKSFFSWLQEEEYIIKNPTKKIKQTKEPKRLRHAMSDEEIELLKLACRTDREKALVEFLVSTGCRLSEVVGINIQDINWYDMELAVIGKGNKERDVYFTVKAKILIKKYLANRKGENKALFIASKFPFARLGGRSIENEINKIAARTNIDKSVFPHLFRHSFATHSINAGMPMAILQSILGHEDAATTMIYAEINKENIKHEYRKLS